MRRPALLPLLAFLPLVLGSCLSVDAQLSVKADGSATLSLDCRISSFARPLLSYEFRQPLPSPQASAGRLPSPSPAPLSSPFLPSGIALPYSKESLLAMAARHPGTRVDSYALDRGTDEDRLVLTLRFSDLETAQAFLRDMGIPLSYTSSGGKRTLSLALDELSPVAATEDAKKNWTAELQRLYGGYQVGLSADLPARVLSAPGGKLSGRTASFSMPSTDMAFLRAPLRWEIQW